jgi:pyruvate dehydrogenase E1 component alpha subunit
MLLMRRFEERCEALYLEGLIGGFLHRAGGEEAVIAGAAAVLASEDAVLTTFRAAPWVLARGGSAERVMAELLGRVDGVAGGRAGSTGVRDLDVGVLGGFGIPGGHAPVAAGVALSGRLALCQMTAGATAQGVVSETLALSATWELPVVSLVTRDVGATDPPPARTELFERAAAFGVAGLRCDGMDVLAVEHVVGDAVARARGERRPVLVEALVRRDVDVVEGFGARLEREGALDAEARSAIEAGVARRVDAAAAFAQASREPLASEL